MVNYRKYFNTIKVAVILKKKKFVLPQTKNCLNILKLLLELNIIKNFYKKNNLYTVVINDIIIKKKIKIIFLNKFIKKLNISSDLAASNSIFLFLTNSGLLSSNSNLIKNFGGFLFLRIDF